MSRWRHYAPAAAERAVPLLHHLAGAIDAAHEAGVLHGSLHLRDVFVSPDEARATGFGVARALEDVGLRRARAPSLRSAGSGCRRRLGSRGGPLRRGCDRLRAVDRSSRHRQRRRDHRTTGVRLRRDEGALPALRDVFAWGLSEDPADRPGRSVEFVTALAEALGVELIEPQPVAAPAPGEPVGVPPPLRSPGAPETEAGVGVGAGLAALAPHDAPDDAPALEDDAAAVDDAAAMDQDEDDDHVGEWSASTAAGSGWDAAAVPPSAAAPTDDLAPLDDLEPIEDEEPLSFSGRVRAGLQVAAAVVVGVVLAGTVYFLFRADVGVGGGDAVAPMEGGRPGRAAGVRFRRRRPVRPPYRWRWSIASPSGGFPGAGRRDGFRSGEPRAGRSRAGRPRAGQRGCPGAGERAGAGSSSRAAVGARGRDGAGGGCCGEHPR